MNSTWGLFGVECIKHSTVSPWFWNTI